MGRDGTAYDLAVTIDMAPTMGRFGLYFFPGATAALELGSYGIDIKYSRSGEISHRSVGSIIVEKGITE